VAPDPHEGHISTSVPYQTEVEPKLDGFRCLVCAHDRIRHVDP